MSAVKLLRHLRLFPAVIVVGSGLLVLKGVGLVHDAQAQTAMTGQVAAAPAPDTTQVAVADPSIDDSDSASAAEVAVLTSLSKRRNELDAREQSLGMQADLIAAAEKRVDDKIASLKGLQSQMQVLLGKRDAAAQAQLNALVKTYSSMKPADAARIFNALDDTVALDVAALMKADVLGAILAKMQPDMAQKLTVRLANRLKLPDPVAMTAATQPMAASTQTASLDPAAATPAPVLPAADGAPTPAPETAPPAAAAPKQPAPASNPSKQATTPSATSKTQTAKVPSAAAPAEAKAQAAAPADAKASTSAPASATANAQAANASPKPQASTIPSPTAAAAAKATVTKPKGG